MFARVLLYINIIIIIIIKFNNIDITTLQGIHNTNNTAENIQLQQYQYTNIQHTNGINARIELFIIATKNVLSCALYLH